MLISFNELCQRVQLQTGTAKKFEHDKVYISLSPQGEINSIPASSPARGISYSSPPLLPSRQRARKMGITFPSALNKRQPANRAATPDLQPKIESVF